MINCLVERFPRHLLKCHAFASGCREPADVAFVFDTSTSMGDDNFYKMVTFFKNLTMMMNIDPNTGMAVRVKTVML